MKHTEVIVQWPEGLHLRVAAKLVKMTQQFQSSICLKVGQKAADTRSVLSLLLLSAGQGARMVIEVSGLDECEALTALQRFFHEPAETAAAA